MEKRKARRISASIILGGALVAALAFGPAAWWYATWYNARFERIPAGMTQARVEQLLGRPVERSKGESCYPFPGHACARGAASCWRYEGKRGMQFVIFFDEPQRVLCVDDFFQMMHW